MKKAILTLHFLFVLIASSFAQEQMTVSEFKSLCDSSGIQFEMPKGYKVIDVKENRDLHYSFSIINKDQSMEVRYTIWPLNEFIAEYEASLEDSNKIMLPPNKFYQGQIQANALNMTGGQLPNIVPFPTEAVKEEFNADAGGSCFFKFNCEFGEGYEFGQFVYLHKDDLADVIITFMSNDMETHSENLMVGFHSLTFK